MLDSWLAWNKKKRKEKSFCSNCFRLVHCVPHHSQGTYRISSAQSVPSSASRWCKPPLRPFACQWRPFVLIQDCTILKKSTWWRQCDTTENINGQTDTGQGDAAFPHSNREEWAAACVTAPWRAGVKQHASVSSLWPTDSGSRIEIKPNCSFSPSCWRRVAWHKHVRGALTRTITRVICKASQKIKLKNQSVQLISNMQLWGECLVCTVNL